MSGQGESGEIRERRVNIDQADGLSGNGTGFDSGSGDDERDMRGLFPDCAFAPVFLLAEMPAVITDEHDDGFATPWVFVQDGEETADLFIYKRDRCLVGLNRGVPLIVFEHMLVVAEAVVHVLVGMRARESARELGHVVPIVASRFGGPLDRLKGEFLEVGGRHLKRAMGTEESHGHEQRLIARRLPLVDRP